MCILTLNLSISTLIFIYHNKQDRLDGLLTIFIEQELAYIINVDDVIDTPKSLTPVNRMMEL